MMVEVLTREAALVAEPCHLEDAVIHRLVQIVLLLPKSLDHTLCN